MPVVSAGLGAYGAIEAGDAASASASYQSQVARNNSTIAMQNAQQATAAGEVQVTTQQLKTAATVGAIRTSQAANGLDVNKGSDVDIQASAKELGTLDALTIRNQAARQAYGYQVQASNFTDQAGLDKAQSSQDATAGYLNATSSVLGTLSSSGNDAAKMMMATG